MHSLQSTLPRQQAQSRHRAQSRFIPMESPLMFSSFARVSLISLSLATLHPIAACASACDDLKTLSLPDTNIDSVATVAAGPYRDGGKYWSLADQLPEHCRVRATLRPTSDSDIKFEVWLP